MEDIYVDFTTRVSEGRSIPLARVQELSKGRVWTGAQAKEIGLVDELGGLIRAIEIAKEAADIDADTKVRIRKFPRPLTTAEQFEQMLNVSMDMGADIQTLSQIANSPELRALLKARAAVNMNTQDHSLIATIPVIK